MASGVMTPFRQVILSRGLMSVSYAPDDLCGDIFALVHLGLRAMFRVGLSDDRFDWIDKYLLNSRASFVVDVKDIYQ